MISEFSEPEILKNTATSWTTFFPEIYCKNAVRSPSTTSRTRTSRSNTNASNEHLRRFVRRPYASNQARALLNLTHGTWGWSHTLAPKRGARVYATSPPSARSLGDRSSNELVGHSFSGWITWRLDAVYETSAKVKTSLRRNSNISYFVLHPSPAVSDAGAP